MTGRTMTRLIILMNVIKNLGFFGAGALGAIGFINDMALALVAAGILLVVAIIAFIFEDKVRQRRRAGW